MLSFSLLVESIPYGITIAEVQRLFITTQPLTVEQQDSPAATLFGLADQVHSQIHYVIGGPLRTLADAALAAVQAALSPAVFAEAFAAGQQMSLVEALATTIPSTIVEERLDRG